MRLYKPPLTDNELEAELDTLATDVRLSEYLNRYPSPVGDFLDRAIMCMRELNKRMHDMQQHYHVDSEDEQLITTTEPKFKFKRYGAPRDE